MRGSPRDPRNYELMTVFAPDIPEDEIQATIDRVVGYITTASGEVVDVNRDSPWGRRRLAYPVRHASRDVRDGFYTLYHFQVAPHRVEDIEREIKLNDRIMRYLVTQYTPKPIDETTASEGAGEAAQTADGTAAEAEVAEAEGEETVSQVASADEAPPAEVAPSEESEPEAAAEPVETAESAEEEAGTEEAAPPEEA